METKLGALLTRSYIRVPAMFFAGLMFVLAASRIFIDESVAWPKSWALDARWPWWFHLGAAVAWGYIWIDLHGKRES